MVGVRDGGRQGALAVVGVSAVADVPQLIGGFEHVAISIGLERGYVADRIDQAGFEAGFVHRGLGDIAADGREDLPAIPIVPIGRDDAVGVGAGQHLAPAAVGGGFGAASGQGREDDFVVLVVKVRGGEARVGGTGDIAGRVVSSAAAGGAAAGVLRRRDAGFAIIAVVSHGGHVAVAVRGLNRVAVRIG